MAYADQEMSGNRIAAIVIVALLHVAIGYTLVTGLAYEAAKSVVERVTTIDVEEPEPEEEEPPPPPEEIPDTSPPPVVTPKPPLNLNQSQNRIEQTDKEVERKTEAARTVTKTCNDGRVIDANASCGPETKRCEDGSVIAVNATCPRVVDNSAPATPRGNAGRWVTTNDYPSRSLREEEEGVTTVTLTIDSSGRVSNCRVSGSSGHSRLDEATCSNMQRRARFNPAKDKAGNPTTGTYTQSVRWQIPQ